MTFPHAITPLFLSWTERTYSRDNHGATRHSLISLSTARSKDTYVIYYISHIYTSQERALKSFSRLRSQESYTASHTGETFQPLNIARFFPIPTKQEKPSGKQNTPVVNHRECATIHLGSYTKKKTSYSEKTREGNQCRSKLNNTPSEQDL